MNDEEVLLRSRIQERLDGDGPAVDWATLGRGVGQRRLRRRRIIRASTGAAGTVVAAVLVLLALVLGPSGRGAVLRGVAKPSTPPLTLSGGTLLDTPVLLATRTTADGVRQLYGWVEPAQSADFPFAVCFGVQPLTSRDLSSSLGECESATNYPADKELYSTALTGRPVGPLAQPAEFAAFDDLDVVVFGRDVATVTRVADGGRATYQVLPGDGSAPVGMAALPRATGVVEDVVDDACGQVLQDYRSDRINGVVTPQPLCSAPTGPAPHWPAAGAVEGLTQVGAESSSGDTAERDYTFGAGAATVRVRASRGLPPAADAANGAPIMIGNFPAAYLALSGDGSGDERLTATDGTFTYVVTSRAADATRPQLTAILGALLVPVR